MGKSLVASMLRRRRVPVFDSDRCVHHLLGPNGKACAAVAKAFPAAWDKKKHLINRKKLGDMIFHTPHQRRKLEAILHPLVAQAQKEFIAKARRTGIKTIVLDIPLLFETNGQRKCDAVICVTAPSFIQRIRVLSRKGMTVERLGHILSQQWPNFLKCRMANGVIATGLGRATTYQNVNKIWRNLVKDKNNA